MEHWGITLSGVWRGALDCCAKKALHPLWTVSWLLHSWITYLATDKSCNRKTRDRPALFSRFIQIVRVPRRVPKPVQSSGRDNPHYEFYLLWRWDVREPDAVGRKDCTLGCYWPACTVIGVWWHKYVRLKLFQVVLVNYKIVREG